MHSTLLKYYTYFVTQEALHRAASRAVALSTARWIGLFYITTLVEYISSSSSMWE